VSEWLAATGDYDALTVLPFYAVYRALVRAKVAAIRGTATEASEYLAMAGRLASRPQPALTITFGLSGSGKTTASSARLLADATANTVRIRSDLERKRLFGLAPGDTSNGAIYTEEATNKTYRRLEKLAEDALEAGWSVIVDAAFLRRALRESFRNLAARLHIPFSIISCGEAPDELRRRLRARRNDASEATVAVLEQQLQWAEALTAEERAMVI
jgi:predicted kinase